MSKKQYDQQEEAKVTIVYRFSEHVSKTGHALFYNP
jgi:hypothetical protein